MSYNPNHEPEDLASAPPAYHAGGIAVHYAQPPPTMVVGQPGVVFTSRQQLLYPRTTSVYLGVAQLFMALGSLTGGTLALVFNASMASIGVGIWCGIFYLVAGSVALAAGCNPTKSMVTATAVTSGFNIAFGITEVTIAASGVSQDIFCTEYESYESYDCYPWGYAIVVAANCLMIVAGSWQVIFGIWLLAVSCHSLHSKSNSQVAVVPVTYVNGSNGAVLLPMQYQQPVHDYDHQSYATGSSDQPQMIFHSQDHQMQRKDHNHLRLQ